MSLCLHIEICGWHFFYRIHRAKAELDIETERLLQRKQQERAAYEFFRRLQRVM